MTKPRRAVEFNQAPPAEATPAQRQLVADELALRATALREQAARELAERAAAGHYDEGAAVRDALMFAADRADARAAQWRTHGNEV